MYEYDMDYDTAAEIAFDSNKYFDLMPDEFATGGRVKYSNGTPSESDRVKELMDDGYTFGEAVKKGQAN